MCFTLSQSRSSPVEDAGISTLRGVADSLAIASLVLLAMLACSRVDTGDTGDTGIENEFAVATDALTASDVAEASLPFDWPEDPGHPVLGLEIESKSKTAAGMISIELMPELAPVTVASIIDLAKNQYYDGTTFHRVIPGFMIQGGDPNSRDRNPNNDGEGNGQVTMPDEFGRAPFLRGVVGMGNKGQKNSTGGQFFIMHADNRSLDGHYTVVGRVISGMKVVDSIAQIETDRVGRWGPRDRPIENVVMKKVGIAVSARAEALRSPTPESKSARLADR